MWYLLCPPWGDNGAKRCILQLDDPGKVLILLNRPSGVKDYGSEGREFESLRAHHKNMAGEATNFGARFREPSNVSEFRNDQLGHLE